MRMRFALFGIFSSLVALAVQPDAKPEGVSFDAQERHKWRFTVGPVFNFNMRSHIGVKPGRSVAFSSQMAQSETLGATSRQAALDQITGASDPNGVKRYEGGAWIDPNDSSHDGTETWNFQVPSAEKMISGGQLTLKSATFSQTSTTITRTPEAASTADDFYAPGVNFEISRELYFNPDWHVGLDAAFGFSWFFCKNCFRGGGEYYRREDTVQTGHFTERFDISDMEDPDGNYPIYDGVFGEGTFAGPGPVLNLRSGRISEIIDSAASSTDVSSYGAYYRGNYNEFEMVAALRPFYEPWEWLRVYGTIGVGVSYMRISFDENIQLNGADVKHGSHIERSWDCYGVAGLGAVLHYNNFLLGFDFYARFLQDELDLNSPFLRGSVSRAPWMFRCYLGVEF